MKSRGPAAALLLAAVALGSTPVKTDSYRAEIRSPQKSLSAFVGETTAVTLVLGNKGSTAWESKGDSPCLVSYHILDPRKKILRYEHPRATLPAPVPPGGKARLAVTIKAPLEAGDYLVEFDLLVEGRLWFKDEGSPTLLVPLRVEEPDWPGRNREPFRDEGAYTALESGVPEFDALAKLIRITLGHNEVSFDGRSGRVDGFFAGGGYPQIWLRDANTIIPASKLHYPLPRLESWLVEHLGLQKPDGALWDWTDSTGRTDKNTVETDQEASAVQAAFQVFRLEGARWPLKPAAGERIVDRLEKALAYVLKERFDAGTGLVLGAHTADWGDVESEDADQSAVYLGPTSRPTMDIYDQSMFYEAALELAEMLDASGAGGRAGAWRRRAAGVKESANRHLWMPERGYYRVHVHKDGSKHEFDEDGIFAMGGNVQAILSGLADDPGADKAGRILAKALALQKETGVSTVSGTLLPPYPLGFFRHPVLDEPFEYQNGGQWDWFGGRLVWLLFERGRSAAGREKLKEIAQKNLANGGFYEWDARDGAGRGSDFFTGSAGSLARALFEGYLGIRIDGSGFALSPRLGTDEAEVRVHVSATGGTVAYDYRVREPEKTVIWKIRSNRKFPATVSLLNPWPVLPAEGSSDKPGKPFEVRKDGAPIPFTVEKTGADEYIRFAPGPRGGSFEIRCLRPAEFDPKASAPRIQEITENAGGVFRSLRGDSRPIGLLPDIRLDEGRQAFRGRL